jgi:hypothetical protein
MHLQIGQASVFGGDTIEIYGSQFAYPELTRLALISLGEGAEAR